MIPVEMGIHTYRVSNFDPGQNDLERRANLDLLEETRETASMRNRNYQRWAKKYYNARVKSQRYMAGDLVL